MNINSLVQKVPKDSEGTGGSPERPKIHGLLIAGAVLDRVPVDQAAITSIAHDAGLQLREQRQSFACSNTNIENERIPREMVAEADREIEADSGYVTGEPFQSTPRVRALRRPQG